MRDASRDHIIEAGTYEALYGAPPPHPIEEWKEWMREFNKTNPGPTPEEYHIDNCPGCEAR